MDNLLRALKAASDPTRLRILAMLSVKPLCVCEVMSLLGMAQSTASKHLMILADAGLARSKPGGTWTIYALARGGFVNNRGEDADRSYGGAEVGFAKAVSRNASVAVYGRVDVADEEAFVRHLAGGGIQASKSAGGAMGVVLSVAY